MAGLRRQPALYDEDELGLHRDRFLALLRRLAEAPPTTPVAGLELLLPGEHPRDAPVRDLPVTATLTELFERQVRARPERVALTHEGERLTYAQLDARANRLARLLAERGAGPGRVVALALPGACGCCPPCWRSSRPAPPTSSGRRPPGGTPAAGHGRRGPALLVTETGLARHLTGDVPAIVLDDPAVEADLAAGPPDG
ncbi:AMP-binding protein [Streptomyces sp. M10(2022)]